MDFGTAFAYNRCPIMNGSRSILFMLVLTAATLAGLLGGAGVSTLLDHEAREKQPARDQAKATPASGEQASRPSQIVGDRIAGQRAVPAPKRPEARDHEARSRQLEERIDTLEREKSQLQTQLTELLNWMITNYKGTYPLPESYMTKLQLTPVSDEFALNPEVAELLKITPEEETFINDAFAATKDFIEQMQMAIMRVQAVQPGKVHVHIPAFPEEGGIIREDLHLALEATLGGDRFDRFMEVTEKGLESSFHAFGELARTIVFEVVYPDGSDFPLLQIRDGWIREEDALTRQVTAIETTVAELPEAYVKYIEWLPEYDIGGR